jgi:predicted dinucleotide-binding enzyme
MSFTTIYPTTVISADFLKIKIKAAQITLNNQMMKIGILGSGEVGKTLAKGCLKYDYEVMIGSDHVEKLEEFKNENPKLQTATFEQAAQWADLLVLCVKGTAAEKVVEKVRGHVSGKTVVDATNPIADAPPQNGVLKFFTNLEESLMERLQRIASDAHFVKALNSIGAGIMINPVFENGIKPTMFICGNNDEAKKKVTEIVQKFGFEIEDLGKAESARAIEPLCILWCIPGLLRNEWTHAFKLLKK